MGKFIIHSSEEGYSFRLLAANSECVARSDIYASRNACLRGIESVRRNASAHVEDQTLRGYESLPNPKYELYKDRKRQYRYRLRARNGKLIAEGGGHGDKNLCLQGIESVRRNAAKAKIVEKNG